jgi:hypothetical protein
MIKLGDDETGCRFLLMRVQLGENSAWFADDHKRRRTAQCFPMLPSWLTVWHVETGNTQNTSITAAAMEHWSNGDLSTPRNVTVEKTCKEFFQIGKGARFGHSEKCLAHGHSLMSLYFR